MENTLICQSCGMPLQQDVDFGTNADGSWNDDYCVHCYGAGAFTRPEITVGEMVELNLEFLDHFNAEQGSNYTPEEARKELIPFLSSLKRWKK